MCTDLNRLLGFFINSSTQPISTLDYDKYRYVSPGVPEGNLLHPLVDLQAPTLYLEPSTIINSEQTHVLCLCVR